MAYQRARVGGIRTGQPATHSAGNGDFADLWRRDLRRPIPVGASLGPAYRSTIMLRITLALTSHSFLQIIQVLRRLP